MAMRIHHLAIWTHDLERLKDFYQTFFAVRVGPPYHNSTKGFRSYFIDFGEGAKIELMQMPGIPATKDDPLAQATGLTHIAISVGSEAEVDRMTTQLEEAGYTVAGRPRWTGDGYYESVVLDPDGNRLEITI